MRCCIACGKTGHLELHHVGGREYSPVTIELCPGCHLYCTIAGNYERQWFAEYPPLMIWAGVMDVLNLCGRSIGWNGINRAVSGYLRGAELSGVYVYRPAAAVVTVNDSLPNSIAHRVAGIQRMTGEAIRAMTRTVPGPRTGEARRDADGSARRGSPDARQLGAAGQRRPGPRRDAEARTARRRRDQGHAETGATPETGRLGDARQLGEARKPETRAAHG